MSCSKVEESTIFIPIIHVVNEWDAYPSAGLQMKKSTGMHLLKSIKAMEIYMQIGNDYKQY